MQVIRELFNYQRFVRKRELAEIISISPRTLDLLMARKIVPYIKVGRIVLFDPEQVVDALRNYERTTKFRDQTGQFRGFTREPHFGTNR
jgi:hypothetical protein